MSLALWCCDCFTTKYFYSRALHFAHGCWRGALKMDAQGSDRAKERERKRDSLYTYLQTFYFCYCLLYCTFYTYLYLYFLFSDSCKVVLGIALLVCALFTYLGFVPVFVSYCCTSSQCLFHSHWKLHHSFYLFASGSRRNSFFPSIYCFAL